MENAADAIKMAGAVLLFVLATIHYYSALFDKQEQTTDLILDARDRETTYINGNYYYKATGITKDK